MKNTLKAKLLIFKTRQIQKLAFKLQDKGIIPPDPVEEKLYTEALASIYGKKR